MMNARSLIRQSFVSVLVAAVATLLAYPISARAQLKVIISGGFSTAYRQVLPEFERSTGITVTTLSGSSQGKGPETIAAQLGRDVPADVAILSIASKFELPHREEGFDQLFYVRLDETGFVIEEWRDDL